MKTTLLTTAYLPPIEYIEKCLDHDIQLEVCEHYIKQSFRNRALIATANGIQTLTVPVVHFANKMPILDVRIDYAMPWQRQHWRSIDAAYSGSPYFMYFQDYFRPFYEKKFEFLFDFNTEITATILKLMGKDFKPSRTHDFVLDYKAKEEVNDLRATIHPKLRNEADYPFKHKAYTQIFEDRIGFVPNLSIIDYLFNEGPHLR